MLRDFEINWAFHNVRGNVDGTHIPIVSPTECPANYFNRKGWHSIVMQGMVNNVVSWLMKAFPNNASLSCQQKTFNYRLSRARVVVEHAYGRLKGRWRTLLKRNDTSIHDLPKLVAACCVLHNICEIHGENFNEEWLDGVTDHTSDCWEQDIGMKLTL